jgi:hypothetical protein
LTLLPNGTKIIIELIPNVGLSDIHFGLNRIEVRKKMYDLYGTSEYKLRNENTDCYFRNSLQFSYEGDNTLSFIETASPPPIFVRIYDINTWEIPGDKLFNLLKEKDSINTEISGNGSNPIFENIHVTLWDLDMQYDHIGNCKTPKWGAIGIGDDRYYESICSIYRRFK